MTANSGSGEVRQQIGEILATVRQLDRQQVETTHSMERIVERVQQDLEAMKHEARNSQQVVQQKLEIMSNEQSLLKQRLGALEDNVGGLKKPVEDMAQFRRHLSALGMLVLSVGTVVWAIVSPLWSAVANRFFGFGH
jgi:predicted RNA-binding protein with EMAP domain